MQKTRCISEFHSNGCNFYFRYRLQTFVLAAAKHVSVLVDISEKYVCVDSWLLKQNNMSSGCYCYRGLITVLLIWHFFFLQSCQLNTVRAPPCFVLIAHCRKPNVNEIHSSYCRLVSHKLILQQANIAIFE